MDEALPLGRAARTLWSLRDDASLLNHGSYGAVPRAVQAAHQALREELERHPDAFMARIKPDGVDAAIRGVAADLAPFVGLKPEALAIVESATQGLQSALGSVELRAGDEILVTDHQYNAVRLAVESRARATGATVRLITLPVPTTADDIVERVLAGVGARTRLVIIDHLTSPTALLMPLDRLLPEFRRREIPVLVDGAHTLGQVPLDLAALDADWYVTNAHKWLYAPRGSALLAASPRVRASTRPLIVSHHVELGFPGSFDYVGTRDYTAWMSMPSALAFHRSLGFERLHAHNSRLIDIGSEALQSAGAAPVVPRELCAWMRAFVLPQQRAATAGDAEATLRNLWERERIQIRCAVVDERLLLRFCAQAYVDVDEPARLGEALARQGWPGRTSR
ncbi:MAG: aminotransferase class V-fold PLP-dependent enzyme [Steroidobacteraceae bacterium]